MGKRYGLIMIFSFAAVLLGGVGCSSDDSHPPPNIAGQYDLSEFLTSFDSCALGDLTVPMRIAQSGSHAVLTTGPVPGPGVCGGLSEGTVNSNRVLPTEGETVFADYWFSGCDLIETETWSLAFEAGPGVEGTWTITFRDDPLGCSGFSPADDFPCTNTYDVVGGLCDGCFDACPAPASGTSQRPGGTWLKR